MVSYEQQRKIGRTEAGSQHYPCGQCGRRYSPEPKQQGYDDQLRQQAIQLYSDGMNFRRIARYLGVSHQSVINWVGAHSARLPAQPQLHRFPKYPAYVFQFLDS